MLAACRKQRRRARDGPFLEPRQALRHARRRHGARLLRGLARGRTARVCPRLSWPDRPDSRCRQRRSRPACPRRRRTRCRPARRFSTRSRTRDRRWSRRSPPDARSASSWTEALATSSAGISGSDDLGDVASRRVPRPGRTPLRPDPRRSVVIGILLGSLASRSARVCAQPDEGHPALLGQPSVLVVACASPTGFDWLDPRWRSQIENRTIDATARNSDCQFCTVRFQKSEEPAYCGSVSGAS